eukprot:TRINITY_DN7285_c0_g1_i1.p1 TRINITY_DN7285_c0_g1~~TRINITY_DN7285_c0_g1_i1.p1  ORF type:complete len:183 (-),score=33.88 TRINITY_DN7285_c0_g1_i1:28-576(-)
MNEDKSWEDLAESDWPSLHVAVQKKESVPNPNHYQAPQQQHISDSSFKHVHPFFASQPQVRILKKETSPSSENRSTPSGPTLMLRPKASQNSNISTISGIPPPTFQPPPQFPTQPQKSLEERQREYERARAAIFNNNTNTINNQIDTNKQKNGESKNSPTTNKHIVKNGKRGNGQGGRGGRR